MKNGKLSNKEKEQILNSLNNGVKQAWLNRADNLETIVPGIKNAIEREIDGLEKDISTKSYWFAIQAQIRAIYSWLEWAEKGLYKEVRGNTWVYA